MVKVYRKIQTTDRDLNRVQQQIDQTINPVLKLPLLDSVEIKNIEITTAGVEVEHGLGRQPLGWIITDVNANATIWKVAWTDRLLTLDSSATATISLLVY